MPQILRQLRLAFRRYFSGNAVVRWIYKQKMITLSDPGSRAMLSLVLHCIVLSNICFILWSFRTEFTKFVRLAVYAFYASGSFELLCALAEYFERRNVRTGPLRSDAFVYLYLLGNPLDTGPEDGLCHDLVSLRGLQGARLPIPVHSTAAPSARTARVSVHCRARRYFRMFLSSGDIRVPSEFVPAIQDLLVTPKDVWPMGRHGWAKDMLVLDQAGGRTVVFPLPDMQSLSRSFVELVEADQQHLAINKRLKDLAIQVIAHLHGRVHNLERRHATMEEKAAAVGRELSWCAERMEQINEENSSCRERLFVISRVYHLLVWRRLVELSQATDETTATHTRLALLLAAHESLESDYNTILEEKEELLLELADQDDQLHKAQDEVTEWQYISEGVCFSHSTMVSEFKAAKMNMHNAVYSLLSCLVVVWRFAMALKIKSAARAHLDRQETAILRRRLVLVESAKAAAVNDRTIWRSMYEETEGALDEMVDVYTQQRSSHLAQTRQLLTGLLLLWRYCRVLKQNLYEAHLRIHTNPVSCEEARSATSVSSLLQARETSAPSADLDEVNDGELTAAEVLSLSFSHSNIAYASLLVQYEQLQDDFDDIHGALEDEHAARVSGREKLQAELADARKVIEDLRTERMAETDKLRNELEEARRTIMTLHTAKEAAELELQNKRTEIVLARATVRQMRAEVEETKRSLESTVMEWSDLAAGAGRPMILNEPRDNDDLRSSAEGRSSFPMSLSEDEDVVLLPRVQSPPMLMERRERELLIDPSELVRQFPAPPPPPIEYKSSNRCHRCVC